MIFFSIFWQCLNLFLLLLFIKLIFKIKWKKILITASVIVSLSFLLASIQFLNTKQDIYPKYSNQNRIEILEKFPLFSLSANIHPKADTVVQYVSCSGFTTGYTWTTNDVYKSPPNEWIIKGVWTYHLLFVQVYRQPKIYKIKV